MRSARMRSASRMSSPSRSIFSRKSWRSLSSQRACFNSSGSRSSASSSSSRTSSLLSSLADDDSGIWRVLLTMSSTRRRRISALASVRPSETVIARPPLGTPYLRTPPSGELLLQLDEDRARHHGPDPICPAEMGELANVLRRHEGVLRRTGYEQRLDTGHRLVHLGLLQLGLGVGRHAQALDDDVDAELPGQVHDQAGEGM